jgi:hypothetical protein
VKRKPVAAAVAVPTAAAPAAPWYAPWVVLLVIVLLTAAVRIRLLETPLERDEGEYAYAGQLLLQGIPPYQYAFNMKFPGVYGAYAVMMGVFGQTVGGIHFGFLLLNAGTIILVFLLGRRLFNSTSGVAAAAAYALLSLGQGIFGTQAHATHFVIAAALGGTLLLLRGVESGKSGIFLTSGLLYGLAILMKQHGVFFAMFGGLYLLWKCWRRPRSLALFFGGLAAPLLVTVLALWRAGVLPSFWFWTISYAREYAGENSFAEGIPYFTGTFPHVVGADWLLWLGGAAGLLVLWWRDYARGSTLFLTMFLLFSMAAICPGWWFREHYFVLLLPAVALLAGSLVSPGQRISWWIFGGVLAVSIAQQTDFLFRWSPVYAVRQMFGYCPFPEAVHIGEMLREHSAPNARIAVLGSEPEIYFYAHRLSATGYIYTYNMMEPQPFALTMQNDMIRELETNRPEYIVFVNMASSWSRRPDSPVRIDDWWNAYSAQNYRLIGAADILTPERTEYHWENLEAYHPLAQLITVYKRKYLATNEHEWGKNLDFAGQEAAVAFV